MSVAPVAEQSTRLLRHNTWWIKDSANPVLPPIESDPFEKKCAMNPYAVRIGDEYHLYYAGADENQMRRICLATASVDDPTQWKRHGVVLDVGQPGSFDSRWVVLPHVVEIEPGRWYLYYTANNGEGKGLAQFPGIGLATSTDGKNWQRYGDAPILAPSHNVGDPDAIGMAGGSVVRVKLPDGSQQWRFYYTGCPTYGEDIFLNQQKVVCLAVSDDAIHWEKRGALMRRNPDHDYENVAVAGPVVRQLEDGSYQMWYSAIGTRWGFYSICYAESEDGLTWRRGENYGDNLQLAPVGEGWERQMVQYPSVTTTNDARLRLFYNGNGYGQTGIGTALASPLRATPVSKKRSVNVVSATIGAEWKLKLPASITRDGNTVSTDGDQAIRWHGPDNHGRIWYEDILEEADCHLQSRLTISPAEHGLHLRWCVTNCGNHPIDKLSANIVAHSGDNKPCLSADMSIANLQAGQAHDICGGLNLIQEDRHSALRYFPTE